jgi:hypothetical protein
MVYPVSDAETRSATLAYPLALWRIRASWISRLAPYLQQMRKWRGDYPVLHGMTPGIGDLVTKAMSQLLT